MEDLVAALQFDRLAFWHWLIIAAVLLGFELFIAYTSLLLWLGVAAIASAAVAFALPSMAWEWQVVLYAALSVVAVYVGRAYFRRHRDDTDTLKLNRRGEQYVDRVFTLERAIVNGQGRIKVGDTLWKVEGPDLELGAAVRVVAADGVVLKVVRSG